MKQQTINKILSLKENGLNQSEISNKLNIPRTTVRYWMIEESKRKEINKKTYEKFISKTLEERREVYKKRLPYLTEYQRKRYNKDKAFREKKKLLVRKYYKNKNGKTRNTRRSKESK